MEIKVRSKEMKIRTIDGATTHAQVEQVAVRKNLDGAFSVWICGTAMGWLYEEDYTCISRRIAEREAGNPLGGKPGLRGKGPPFSP